MNDPQRRDTGLTGQTLYSDPSAKIWGLYLSQAEKFDKEHSDSWTANTDGVLVFVRQCLVSQIVPNSTPSDWSFLRDGSCIYRRQLSTAAAQSKRYHQSAARPNLSAIVGTPKWDVHLGTVDRHQQIFVSTYRLCRACECAVVH